VVHTLRRQVKSEIASDAPTEVMSPSIASLPWILPTMEATMALQESLAALTSLDVSHGSSSSPSTSCPPPCDACDPKTRLIAKRPRASENRGISFISTPGCALWAATLFLVIIDDCVVGRARDIQNVFASHSAEKNSAFLRH
jgi:hypothetical protein